MKRQKISLSLRKQKISSLSGKQINGGDFAVQIITRQANCVTSYLDCRSVLHTCEPLKTVQGCATGPISITMQTINIDAPK